MAVEVEKKAGVMTYSIVNDEINIIVHKQRLNLNLRGRVLEKKCFSRL
jgi:hypothetical protein